MSDLELTERIERLLQNVNPKRALVLDKDRWWKIEPATRITVCKPFDPEIQKNSVQISRFTLKEIEEKDPELANMIRQTK